MIRSIVYNLLASSKHTWIILWYLWKTLILLLFQYFIAIIDICSLVLSSINVKLYPVATAYEITTGFSTWWRYEMSVKKTYHNCTILIRIHLFDIRRLLKLGWIPNRDSSVNFRFAISNVIESTKVEHHDCPKNSCTRKGRQLRKMFLYNHRRIVPSEILMT